MKRDNQNRTTNRMDRINEELKREISHIINYEMKNTNVTGLISVTKVDTSPDLKHTKVDVSIINSKSIKNTLEALKSSAGFIRSRLAEKVNMRVTPSIRFEHDDSMQYGQKIDSILQEIMKDIKPSEEDEETNLENIE
ncbi:MAG: 30S ribosome-binding factor RbfA [Oscillospiraceae bacterium]|nr:30S ribosome-binding factor RbfA [Oscillospiraceae bacterium]